MLDKIRYGEASLPIGKMIGGGIVVLFSCILLFYSGQHYYIMSLVGQDEVGVKFESGRILEVVGPGVYSDMGWNVDLVLVPSRAIPIQVEDAELITRDKQRIGLLVTADIFRPGLADSQQILDLWPQYNPLFTDDERARTQVDSRIKQAMKVCVGDQTFDAAVIGQGRDVLRDCISAELDVMSSEFGLNVRNVAVPNVALSSAVQAQLDEIVKLRLQTEQALQRQYKANAEANANQATQEGEIRVQQSRIQEEARQQTALAQLEQEKVLAQKAVIEAQLANELARVEANNAIVGAQKTNDLLAAQRDVEIAEKEVEKAKLDAQARTATQAALALIYAQSPWLPWLEGVGKMSAAIKPTDKIFYLPNGSVPTFIMPGPAEPTVMIDSQK